jgi:KUP system potassium uptake protein
MRSRPRLTAAGARRWTGWSSLGVLSLIFWSLLVVVTLKYVVLIMRADNEGEGGILSLFALVQRTLCRRQPLAAHHRDAGGAGRGAVLL